MRTDRDTDKLDRLEVEVVHCLRLMTPESREKLLAISRIHAELFPQRPTLRLVKSHTGGCQ